MGKLTLSMEYKMMLKQLENEEKMTYKKRSVLDLALQVLNGRLNFYQEENNVKELFRVYTKVFENEMPAQYKDSMKTSKDLYKKNEKYKTGFKNLKNNLASSFVIVPISARGHMFAAVVRKIDEKYSVMVINKGARGAHDSYEEYVLDFENLNDSFQEILGEIQPIADVYKILSNNAIAKYKLGIKAKDQKIGNCFIKQPENAIKFATSTSGSDVNKIKALRYTKDKVKIGWPVHTNIAHKRFIDILIHENPDLKNILSQEYKNYARNKTFRNYRKVGLTPKQALIRSFDPKNTTKNVKEDDRVRNLLKMINLDTIMQNSSSVDLLMKNYVADPEVKKLIKDLRYYFIIGNGFATKLFFYEGAVNFITRLWRKETFIDKLEANLKLAQEYLPRAAVQLKYDFHTAYMMSGLLLAMLGISKKANQKFEVATRMYKFTAEVSLFKGLNYLSQNDIHKGVKYIEEAMKLKPEFKEAVEFYREFKDKNEEYLEKNENRNYFIEFAHKKGLLDEKEYKSYLDSVEEANENKKSKKVSMSNLKSSKLNSSRIKLTDINCRFNQKNILNNIKIM